MILSDSDVLLLEVGPTSPWRADLEEIRTAGRRAADLTRQVLAFSRRQVMEPKILDLNEIIANAGKMLARLLGEHIELKTRLAPDLGLVKADPGQIEQIIMNLVVNARDAMPQGGQLVIATSNVQVDAPLAAEHHGLMAGHHVMIAVSDTGVGIDKATQARIFEPFFTTKPTGKGTGLGLATVFGIVQQSRGAVWVDSEPNVGTTFRVYLPWSAGKPSWRPSTGEPRVDARGTETILLVEDEDQVRAVVSLILKNAGYRVLEAAGPGEAFVIYEEHGAEIDMLLTDVVMPKLSGRQLAERIASQHAGVKVLLMSGYADDATLHDGILGADVAFVHKPLTPSTLTRKVREVLDAP